MIIKYKISTNSKHDQVLDIENIVAKCVFLLQEKEYIFDVESIRNYFYSVAEEANTEIKTMGRENVSGIVGSIDLLASNFYKLFSLQKTNVNEFPIQKRKREKFEILRDVFPKTTRTLASVAIIAAALAFPRHLTYTNNGHIPKNTISKNTKQIEDFLDKNEKRIFHIKEESGQVNYLTQTILSLSKEDKKTLETLFPQGFKILKNFNDQHFVTGSVAIPFEESNTKVQEMFNLSPAIAKLFIKSDKAINEKNVENYLGIKKPGIDYSYEIDPETEKISIVFPVMLEVVPAKKSKDFKNHIKFKVLFRGEEVVEQLFNNEISEKAFNYIKTIKFKSSSTLSQNEVLSQKLCKVD